MTEQRKRNKETKLMAKQRYVSLLGKALEHFDLTDEGRAKVGLAFAKALLDKPRLEGFRHDRTGLVLFAGRITAGATKVPFSKGLVLRDVAALSVFTGAVTQIKQAESATGEIYVSSVSKDPSYVVGILMPAPVVTPPAAEKTEDGKEPTVEVE